MIVDIVDARYLDGYRIWVKFNTNDVGIVDLEELIYQHPAAEPLRNIEEFKCFHLDSWPTLAWECGFDIAPEALYTRATGKAHEWEHKPSEGTG